MLPVIIASMAASTAARTAASTVITGNAAIAARRRRDEDTVRAPSVELTEADHRARERYREFLEKRLSKMFPQKEAPKAAVTPREFDSSSWTGR